MSGFIRQIIAVTMYNARNITQRASVAGVVVIGVAATVAVLVSVLAMATGFRNAVTNSARENRAIVLRSGSQWESASALSRGDVLAIMDAPGILKDGKGVPVASAEAATVINIPLKATGNKANLILRGVGPEAMVVRPEMRITDGRTFRTGTRELIVGRAAARQFAGLEIGDRIVHNDLTWSIVGVFASNGDSHESEAIGDVATVMSALRRAQFQEVVVQLDSAAAFDTFKGSLTNNPALSVDVRRETDYYEEQSLKMRKLLFFVANVVGGIMAVGAIFGALNTMYTAVSARTLEIGTFRALGFGAAPVAISVMFEALTLALIGSLLGAGVSWLFFSGQTVNTLGPNFAQLAFQLNVTPAIIAAGVVWACVIGFIGGLLPAIRAARIPIVAALRAS